MLQSYNVKNHKKLRCIMIRLEWALFYWIKFRIEYDDFNQKTQNPKLKSFTMNQIAGNWLISRFKKCQIIWLTFIYFFQLNYLQKSLKNNQLNSTYHTIVLKNFEKNFKNNNVSGSIFPNPWFSLVLSSRSSLKVNI